MHPLVPLAVLTTVLAALLTWRTARRQEGLGARVTLVLLAAGLPLSTVVNVAVKKPLSTSVADWAQVRTTLSPATPLWFLGFALLLAPVTEELIKLVPVVLASWGGRLNDPARAVACGIVAGMAFGVGEVLFLGLRLMYRGEYADMPWYAFVGFLGERLLATVLHGGMTGLVVYLWRQRTWWLPLAVLPSIGVHALVNLFPLLGMAKILDGAVGMVSAALVPLVILVVLIVHLERFRVASAAREGQGQRGETLWRSRYVDKRPEK